jgi:hypothetical protein
MEKITDEGVDDCFGVSSHQFRWCVRVGERRDGLMSVRSDQSLMLLSQLVVIWSLITTSHERKNDK